jgi:hypothetical protein
MPYLRQRQKIPENGRITVKLTPAQRDQLIGNSSMPRRLGHLLHRAAVKQGKLHIRLTRLELDTLIDCAVVLPIPNPASKRALDIFIDYLETQADRFEPADEEESNALPGAL